MTSRKVFERERAGQFIESSCTRLPLDVQFRRRVFSDGGASHRHLCPAAMSSLRFQAKASI